MGWHLAGHQAHFFTYHLKESTSNLSQRFFFFFGREYNSRSKCQKNPKGVWSIEQNILHDRRNKTQFDQKKKNKTQSDCVVAFLDPDMRRFYSFSKHS